MAWKGLHLSRPARLSLTDRQIVIALDDGVVRQPLEDIAWIILESDQATLTTSLMSACMEAGVAVITTDQRHMPNGASLPFHSHHRQAGVARMQLAVTEPFRKRCWQGLVMAKIRAQAENLIGGNETAARTVREMTKLVSSGDPDNVEARAARAYWSALFYDFTRDNSDDLRNSLLNYGYAVMRAALSRALVAYGLLPCIGLHHASVTNAFNLADDLIEPFRPLVDRLAFGQAEGRAGEEELTLEDRQVMATVLTETCRFAGETVTLLVASERCVASLVWAMETNSHSLLQLPEPG